MHQRASDSLQPARFPYPEDATQVLLEGKRVGDINFSHLPETVPAEDVHMALLEPLGPNLGAIMLPPQPGTHVVDSPDDRRYALRINVFRDGSAAAHGATAYILATDAALEQISQKTSNSRGKGAPTPTERESIVTLIEGDHFPVGRGHWLPGVGSHVELLDKDPKLARLYAGTHTDQGEFYVENGELIWHDTATKNRSELIYGGVVTDNVPEQRLVQTGKIGAGALSSVFDQQRDVPGLHDSTGQQAR